MKKLTLIFIATTLLSCERTTLQPIEKYGGGKYVVTLKRSFSNTQDYLLLKCPDSVFTVRVLKFDSQKLNVGDTIK